MKTSRRGFLSRIGAGYLAGGVASLGRADEPSGVDVPAMTERGERFLVGLFDSTVDLLPEYPGSKVYWLYHDNYLAAKVLEATDANLAERIRAKMAGLGVTSSGKIEILFDEVPEPLPFKQFQLTSVTRVGDKEIRTERATQRELKGWQEYADLLALRVLARPQDTEAKESFARLTSLWDGRGFADRVNQVRPIYATYKLALAMLAAERIGTRFGFEPEILDRLGHLQADSGGWITDYQPDLLPVGFANVETTSLVLLALRGWKSA